MQTATQQKLIARFAKPQVKLFVQCYCSAPGLIAIQLRAHDQLSMLLCNTNLINVAALLTQEGYIEREA